VGTTARLRIGRFHKSGTDTSVLPAPSSAAGAAAAVEAVHGGPSCVKVWHRFYIPVKVKFLISTLAASCWFLFSFWISIPWMEELGAVVGETLAVLIILFIALIPGFMMCHLVFSILLDKPPPLCLDTDYPPVSILMAAYNEAENLEETFRGLKGLDYPGEIELIVVDDGQRAGTVNHQGEGAHALHDCFHSRRKSVRRRTPTPEPPFGMYS